MKLEEKFSIVQQCVEENAPHYHVAKKYRISRSYVSNLVSRAKKQPGFLLDLHLREKKDRLMIQ